MPFGDRIARRWTMEELRAHQTKRTAPAAVAVAGHQAFKDRAVAKLPKPAPIHTLVGLCRAAGLPEPVPEYLFHDRRKWRFDYAWPLVKLACEIEGGLWTQGRHSRGAGAIADLEKYSEAAILGWRIVYATPDELANGVALGRVLRALG